jgi:type VI secretion system protein ImpK
MNTATLSPNPLPQTPSVHDDGARVAASQSARSLVDLLHEGFYLLLLLKNRYVPGNAEQFCTQLRRLLDDFERGARRIHVSADDVFAAKYAFCATVDEIVLSSNMEIRNVWERAPLQLLLFGDQVAGENFFTELEEVRRRGAASVQALEVFYMCLLIGFEGKYALDDKEKLNYLVAALDKEIAHLKGKRAPFAPYWKTPDNIKHMMKTDLPLWLIGTVLTLLAVGAYAGISWLLAQHTNGILSGYFDIIKLAPKVANITISLP